MGAERSLGAWSPQKSARSLARIVRDFAKEVHDISFTYEIVNIFGESSPKLLLRLLNFSTFSEGGLPLLPFDSNKIP